MASYMARIHPYLTPLYTPLHSYIPFGPLDIFGAIRSSQVIDWIATGAFDQPAIEVSAAQKSPRKKKQSRVRERASVLQECAGLLIVLFGGETFLAMCTGSTPSWMISPKVGLLFTLTHALQTRTPFRRFIPSRPSLVLELLLAVPDAIGRTLLLTRFSILPLLQPAPNTPILPATPTTLILVPFILASPFAAIAFSGISVFSPRPTLSTPLELRPGGWMMVDAWLPLVLPALFCSLIGPVKGWDVGLGWGEEEATVACLGFVMVAFMGRAVYNYGYRKTHWKGMLDWEKGSRKVKTL